MDARSAGGENLTGTRVSVVLATYNGQQFVREQLASLVAQTSAPHEVVIVDDASTDTTPDILRAFRDEAPFPVQLMLREEHLGTWSTFEEALRMASGDVLVVCDQDDRWHQDKVKVLGDAMNRYPGCLMIFSDARLINPTGRVIGRSRWRVAGYTPSAAISEVDLFATLVSRQAVSGCTMAVRRALLTVMLPFPVDIHPGLPTMMYDRWMSLLSAAAAPVVTVPSKLVDYRIHPGQQVGIPALKLRRLAPKSALHAAQFLHGGDEIRRRIDYHLAHMDEIEKRLAAAEMTSAPSDRRMDLARRHLRFRRSLGGRRLSRVRPVFAELRNRDGYRRHALGMTSAIADVIR